MDRVFSVDGISDQFWSAPPPPPPPSSEKGINRSASEWAFQCFLQEADHVAASPSDSSSDQSDDNTKVDEVDVIEVKNSDTNANVNGNIPVDSEGYQAYLKSKLNIACAAVAQSRATFLKPRDSSTRAESGSQASNASQSASNAPSKGAGYDMSKSQDVNTNGSVTIPSLPNTQKKSIVPVKPTRSGSSREQSDDDENEGETELTENMDPADAKRVRRMLSNRESARRSRRRKQAHLTELETQVSQLRVENSSLLKRLTDIRQKYSEAAVDNRVLKADVETLRAKVKMAEETVKRITGLSPMFHTMPDISTVSMPSYDGSASDTSTDAAVPSQDDKKHQFYQPKKNPIANPDQRFQNALLEISSVENVQPNSAAPHLAGSKMGRTSSLQRVASLEHLQKRIRGGVTCGTQSSGDQQ